MTEQLKEKIKAYYVGDDIDKVLDYITNLQQDIANYVKITLHDRKEIDRLQQENERLKEQNKEWKDNHKAVCIQRDNILDNIVKDTEERINYKSRCENTDKIMYEFEEWLKSNFWNDDEGNESYQIEKYTTFYSVYRKLDLLKTLNKGDVNETNS